MRRRWIWEEGGGDCYCSSASAEVRLQPLDQCADWREVMELLLDMHTLMSCLEPRFVPFLKSIYIEGMYKDTCGEKR